MSRLMFIRSPREVSTSNMWTDFVVRYRPAVSMDLKAIVKDKLQKETAR